MKNKIIEIALGEYGQKEIKGPNGNPRIVQYFSETGFDWVKDNNVAWCAAFINWVLKEAGQIDSNSLLARSFLEIGAETETPELGDVVVLWRISKDSRFGHAGFYITEDSDEIFILGGNQDGAVSIKKFPKWQLLGYRRVYETNS